MKRWTSSAALSALIFLTTLGFTPAPALAQFEDEFSETDEFANEPVVEDNLDAEVEEFAPSTAEEQAPAEFPYPGAVEEGFKPGAAGVINPLPARRRTPTISPSQVERPVRISEQGEYFYAVDNSEKDAAFSMRLGFFAPPDIENPDNRVKFDQIYGSADVPVLFLDYEWQLTRAFGDIGIKVGSGLFVRNGPGKFKDPERADDLHQPRERFTFVMLPNTLTALYRFQYHPKQPIVPFVEGGVGLFTFAETRDDNKGLRGSYAPVSVAAGGMNFLMDWLDPRAVQQLDRDYGINHVWLTAEYRMILGTGEYDFSSRVINAGILLEF